jgi:hypothetical protein
MTVLPNYHPIVFIGAVSCAINIIIHVYSAVVGIRFVRYRSVYPLVNHKPTMYVYVTTVVTVIFFLAHIIEIAVWAVVFIWIGQFDHVEPAFYHSSVNYTTLGYGNTMESPWHLLEPMEATAGILAFGISTAAMSTLLMKMMEEMQDDEVAQNLEATARTKKKKAPDAS